MMDQDIFKAHGGPENPTSQNTALICKLQLASLLRLRLRPGDLAAPPQYFSSFVLLFFCSFVPANRAIERKEVNGIFHSLSLDRSGSK